MSDSRLPGVTIDAGNIEEFVDGIYGKNRNRMLEGAFIAAAGYAVGRKFARGKGIVRHSKLTRRK